MPKFYCDVNVNRLAKYLRFAGFDVMTRKELSKQKIEHICDKERRVFITRSKQKDINTFKSIEILTSNDVFEQLHDILKRYKIIPENIGSRCILCNVKLRSVTDTEKKYCPRCGRHYHKGNHYYEMMDKIGQEAHRTR